MGFRQNSKNTAPHKRVVHAKTRSSTHPTRARRGNGGVEGVKLPCPMPRHEGFHPNSCGVFAPSDNSKLQSERSNGSGSRRDKTAKTTTGKNDRKISNWTAEKKNYLIPFDPTDTRSGVRSKKQARSVPEAREPASCSCPIFSKIFITLSSQCARREKIMYNGSLGNTDEKKSRIKSRIKGLLHACVCVRIPFHIYT